MNAEFFALAFIAALNPKLLAIDLLLIENRRPRAMFLCVLLGGLTVGITVGLLHVLTIHADAINSQKTVSAGVDPSLGLLLLAAAALVATGRLHGRRKAPIPAGSSLPDKPYRNWSLRPTPDRHSPWWKRGPGNCSSSIFWRLATGLSPHRGDETRPGTSWNDGSAANGGHGPVGAIPGTSCRGWAADQAKGAMMAIGPVQLIVLGFSHPNFHGEIIEELERLHDSGTVRVIDALAVYKDANGELEAEHLSNLSEAEAIEVGSKIGALIGLGFEGEEGAEAGAAAGGQEAAAEGIHVFGGAEEWDVLEDIPNDSAAALILLEHHWAVPLRDAIARAGGFRLADGFISPLDLIEVGLVSAEEAKELHDLETSAAAGNQ
jgi:uncharacterized membrane protein